MHEILFRGKGKGTGKWHEGFYAKCNSKEGAVHCIIEDDYSPSLTGKAWGNPIYEIDPDTLGQFTGMTVNGVKIFEGDIVSFARVNALGYTQHRIGYVRYYEKLPLFYIAATTGDAWDWCECAVKKVIGNVHDNPELLEEDGRIATPVCAPARNDGEGAAGSEGSSGGSGAFAEHIERRFKGEV